MTGRQKLYKLDPGWDQKHIDFEFRDVPEGTQTTTVVVPSIYRFEKDKLLIVFGIVKLAERPESFTWSNARRRSGRLPRRSWRDSRGFTRLP